MATGVRAMVIRVDDEAMWVHPGAYRGGYTRGRVVEVRYEVAVCRPANRSTHYDEEVELVHLRVTRPILHAGDIVSESSLTGRAVLDAEQGVVCPPRMSDGPGWVKVHWKTGRSSRHHPTDLLRIPVPDQDSDLWPLSKAYGDEVGTLRRIVSGRLVN